MAGADTGTRRNSGTLRALTPAGEPRSGLFRLVVTRSVTSFLEGNGLALASGLAYTSLLSFVPLAVSITVLTAPLSTVGRPEFYRFISAFLPGASPDLIAKIEHFAARAQDISIVSTVLFFISSLRVFWEVDSAVNGLWGTVQKRSFWRQLVLAVIVILLGPIASGLITTLLAGGGVPFTRLRVTGIIVSSLALTILYKKIPRSHVGWMPAAIAGAVAGSSLWILRSIFANSVVWVRNLDRVYGSISFILIFVIANGFVWTILLYGVSLAHAIQFRKEALAHDDEVRTSLGNTPLDKAVAILRSLTAAWIRKDAPWGLSRLAAEAELSEPEIWTRLQGLIRAGLVEKAGDEGFRLTRPPDEISLYAAERAVGLSFPRPLPSGGDPVAKMLRRLYRRADREERAVLQGVSLRDLYESDREDWD
ncbi:MAG: YihY/virulence factor BrkB family protein [Acidobacteria bacterium]|nr:YihY/virulence factor BrkB family protein [Acidobacteriota bacterium]MCG3191400.1 hypothetical protein [Thermoanaerobaculia bacterium]MCK6680938.1 YihY/virulence factor BrkB family protein [Thermoanaerobaculia bacterium]